MNLNSQPLATVHAGSVERGLRTSRLYPARSFPRKRQIPGCRRRGTTAAVIAPRRRLHQRDDGMGLHRLVADLNFGAITGRAPDLRQRSEVTISNGSDDPLDFQVVDRRRHHLHVLSLVRSLMPATCIETRTKNWERTP